MVTLVKGCPQVMIPLSMKAAIDIAVPDHDPCIIVAYLLDCLFKIEDQANMTCDGKTQGTVRLPMDVAAILMVYVTSKYDEQKFNFNKTLFKTFVNDKFYGARRYVRKHQPEMVGKEVRAKMKKNVSNKANQKETVRSKQPPSKNSHASTESLSGGRQSMEKRLSAVEKSPAMTSKKYHKRREENTLRNKMVPTSPFKKRAEEWKRKRTLTSYARKHPSPIKGWVKDTRKSRHEDCGPSTSRGRFTSTPHFGNKRPRYSDTDSYRGMKTKHMEWESQVESADDMETEETESIINSSDSN